jgi:hypothetical protein
MIDFKLGDMVEVDIYEGYLVVGKITKLDKFDHDTNYDIEIRDLDGNIVTPWTKWSMRKLSKLEKAMK